MKYTSHGRRWPRRTSRRSFRSVALAAACFLGAAACQQEVTNPSIITPGTLNTPSALPTIRDAALGDFALAYGGSGADGSQGIEGAVMYSGLLADEFINSETFPTRIEVDRRSIQVTNADVTLWFRNLMRARASTEFAAREYRALAPDTTAQSGLSEVLSLSGYTYLFMAENYCSGVPISTIAPDGSLNFGAALTTKNLYDSAAARFTQALNAANALNATVSAASKTLDIQLATVGLGRTIMDSASTRAGFAAAAALVAVVPTNFIYREYHSNNNTREWNGIYTAMVFAKRYAVTDLEGTNPFNAPHFVTAPDPRLPVNHTGNGFDGSTPQWNNGRFTQNTDPIPLATGAEARLIEAEAALATGDTATMLTRLNALRAAPPSYFAPTGGAIPAMAALTTTGLDTAGVQNLLFSEREVWLYSSAHRLGDLRRLAKSPGPYQRAPESVFPHGAYFKGGVYGTDYNFPVPFDETNNPNFAQCINRNP
ncbi:MAG TPA: hypothetical protein VEH62_10660 [Gemmatimonadales bacterium]|nr:hypothetical protein [Gemmatimonadales bacterium]